MDKEKRPAQHNKYTCNDYREEMILLGLQRQLQAPGLCEADRKKIEREIERLEKIIGF
ncbi:hypothetical protein [Desulforhopalus singaporensis]|uniref:Uncharacterized protein n=1 Tax=Desulforhopalus singaporensis TaxID=91360 RepID=A0A1H0J5D9_9BACT|nr:hypothetical protein [Desulforhopalus singaporensis]SDO38955.1 hypothetical protein SAMN05660330_00155 [Desulforhopalus singaporensis]